MKRIVVRFAFVLAIVSAVVAALAGGAYLIGGAAKGRELCRERGIPYHAVIAHRGLSYLAPEETAPAYLLARDLGADYLEADIQRTRDGVLVALHDDTLARTTNVAQVFPDRAGAAVDAFTAAELKRLDAGSWFNRAFPERARPAYAGLRIVTLDELVTIAEGAPCRPGLYLESKSPERYPGIERQMVELLTRRGWIGAAAKDIAPTACAASPGHARARVIFQSFDAGSLALFKRLAPAVPRLYLYDSDEIKKRGWKNVLATARDRDAGAGPSGYEAFPLMNGDSHRAGRFIHVYTINKVWQAGLVTVFGADGIFTDRADVMLSFYGRTGRGGAEELLKKHGY